ncbi:hypothetical protein NMY22_g11945 [Coprinellus aureogranulatus]|nr:hypothetical protein NMY22_g11945 [Coprinellus aureogranulatus]
MNLTFLQLVNHISNLVRNGTLSRSALAPLQSHLVRLAETAEDLGKILSSSASHSSAPSSTRPFSPQFTNPFPTLQPDDNRLGMSLSRARSAQAVPTFKSPQPSLYDSPKSAQATFSGFRIPATSRGASGRDGHGDVGDPG